MRIATTRSSSAGPGTARPTPPVRTALRGWTGAARGLGDELNRPDFGLLVFRFMHTNPGWQHNPENIAGPGTETAVMGPCFPQLSHTDKATFEAGGA